MFWLIAGLVFGLSLLISGLLVGDGRLVAWGIAILAVEVGLPLLRFFWKSMRGVTDSVNSGVNGSVAGGVTDGANDAGPKAEASAGTEAEVQRRREILAAAQRLEVPPDAPGSEIHADRKRLMLQYHPDRHPPERRDGATQQAQEVNAAYHVLIGKPLIDRT